MKRKLLIIIAIPAVILISTGVVLGLNGFFGGGNAVPEDTMTRGLVGYWGFDEGSGTVAHDASSYANNGVASSTWAGGKIGSAAGFDGVDDNVDVPNNASFNSLTTFSVELWTYYGGNNSPSVYPGLVSDGVDATTDGWSFMISGSTGRAYAFFYDTNGIGRSIASATLSPLVPVNSWAHLVLTFVSGGSVITYMNGQKYYETTTAYTPKVATGDLLIGRSRTGQYYQGKIDEVRIYNRALSDAEVKYHYNRGGPVAEWKMDEGGGRTVYDSTDNHNNGTLILAGSATSSAWVSGKFGTALSFDGVDDYVNCGSNTILDLTGNITIDAWVKINSIGTAMGIVNKGNSTLANDPYRLRITAGGKAAISIGNNTISEGSIGNTTLNINTWYHLVGVVNTNTYTIYVNGISDNSSRRTINPYVAVTPLLVGMTDTSLNYPFNGLIDDVRIYNYARTPDEIRLDYNAGFAAKFGYTDAGCQKDPASCMTQGLVGYWNMEEGNGIIAHDVSGNNNNGTLTNGPLWTTGVVPLNGTKSGGGALSFDGVDDYVNVGNPASLQSFPNGITLEAWLQRDWTLASAGERPLSKRESTLRGFLMGFSATKTFSFTLGDGVADHTQLSVQTFTAGNAWHHVVMTYDGERMRIYADGVIDVTSLTAVFTISASLDSFSMPRMVNNLWNGKIDEVRIYNRALTPEEVRYHYNKGAPVAYWKFDEGTGTTTYDISGNGNNGTMYWMSTSTNGGWVPGKLGTALSFDGQDDYVQATVAQTITTVDFWMKSPGGAWQYIANSNGTYYVNGIKSATAPSPYPVYISGASVQIGKTGASAYFNGLIDDVRIYNYARTPDEIRLDYNAGFAAKFGAVDAGCQKDPSSCMTEGLAGYWNFDEGSGRVAHDISGNGNNGVASSTWATGKVGSAGQFDGVDDNASVADNVSLQLTSAVSVEAWVRTGTVLSVTQPVVDKITGTFTGYNLSLRPTNYIWFSVGDGAAFNSAVSNATISQNTWYHLVGTWSTADNTVRLYVNGVLQTTTAVSTACVTNTSNLLMGKYSTSFLTGLIDEAKVYNRVLGAEEVRYHYNKGGPVAYWKFDEGEGRTVYDYSGQGNHGTLVLNGSATSSAWVVGKYGGALSFDGVDDLVNAGNGTSLQLTTAVSVEAWVKATANLGDVRIWNKGTFGGNTGYIISSRNDGTNRVKFTINGNTGKTAAMTGTLSLNTWYYIVGTYDGQNVKLYVGGILVGSDSYATQTSITDSGAVACIGNNTSGSVGWSGLIDDVRIYNYARTPDQIRQDYNEGLGAHFK